MDRNGVWPVVRLQPHAIGRSDREDRNGGRPIVFDVPCTATASLTPFTEVTVISAAVIVVGSMTPVGVPKVTVTSAGRVLATTSGRGDSRCSRRDVGEIDAKPGAGDGGVVHPAGVGDRARAHLNGVTAIVRRLPDAAGLRAVTSYATVTSSVPEVIEPTVTVSGWPPAVATITLEPVIFDVLSAVALA